MYGAVGGGGCIVDFCGSNLEPVAWLAGVLSYCWTSLETVGQLMTCMRDSGDGPIKGKQRKKEKK